MFHVEIVDSAIGGKHLTNLVKFCSQVETTSPKIATNWKVTEWELEPACLLHVLLIQQRFDTGGLCLLYEDDSIVAISGFYQSDIHPDIHIFGVRAWVLQEKRRNLLIAENILPLQLNRMIQNEAKIGVITFTDRTKSFATLIERSNKNYVEGKPLFFFGDRYPQLYRDMRMVPYPVTINFTKQWILVKKLDTHFDFDFESIKHHT